MKIFYMLLLLFFQIALMPLSTKKYDKEMNKIVLLLIGQIAIAVCIIGAFGK